MKVLDIKYEDCVNYKKTSMFISTPYCSGKCWKELGLDCTICQNDELHKATIIDLDDDVIIQRYLSNPLTQAIVFGGFEPMDSFDELMSFLRRFRALCDDEVIIYTGFYECETKNLVERLKTFTNIIIKFGRYIPNRPHRYDDILGVELISNNQYAKRIS